MCIKRNWVSPTVNCMATGHSHLRHGKNGNTFTVFIFAHFLWGHTCLHWYDYHWLLTPDSRHLTLRFQYYNDQARLWHRCMWQCSKPDFIKGWQWFLSAKPLLASRLALSCLVQDSSHLPASLPASLVSYSGCNLNPTYRTDSPENHSQDSVVMHVTHWLNFFQFKQAKDAQCQSELSCSL